MPQKFHKKKPFKLMKFIKINSMKNYDNEAFKEVSIKAATISH